MSDVNQISVDEYLGEDNIEYTDVEVAPGKTIKLGSIDSLTMLRWFEERDDKVKGELAGLYLLVKCIINPDGARIPKELEERTVAGLMKKNAKTNGLLVNKSLALNGLVATGRRETKNGSSGAPTVASPSVSPSR